MLKSIFKITVLKAEGLNAVLLGKVFQYLNRFYVKQQNVNPI